MSVQQILNKVEESIKAIITDKKYNTGGTTQKNEFRKKYASRIEKRREIFSDFSDIFNDEKSDIYRYEYPDYDIYAELAIPLEPSNPSSVQGYLVWYYGNQPKPYTKLNYRNNKVVTFKASNRKALLANVQSHLETVLSSSSNINRLKGNIADREFKHTVQVGDIFCKTSDSGFLTAYQVTKVSETKVTTREIETEKTKVSKTKETHTPLKNQFKNNAESINGKVYQYNGESYIQVGFNKTAQAFLWDGKKQFSHNLDYQD